MKNEWADAVEKAESNISASEMVSERIPLRGRRARHDGQCVDSNSGDPRRSLDNREYGGQRSKRRKPNDGAGVGCRHSTNDSG